MSKQNFTENAYTHSPQLFHNPFLISLQLLLWLFFHPSAWRNYIKHSDLDLSPDFPVISLKFWQKQDQTIKRLTLSFVITVCFACTVNVGLSFLLEQFDAVFLQTVAFVDIGFICASSIVISVGLSATSGLITGASINLGLVASSFFFFVLCQINGFVLAPFDINSAARVTNIGLISGIIASVSIEPMMPAHYKHSVRKEVGAVIVGVLVGAGIVIIAVLLALVTSKGKADQIVLGISSSSTGSYALGIGTSVVLGIGFALAIRFQEAGYRQQVLGGMLFTLFIGAAFILSEEFHLVYGRNLAIGSSAGLALGIVFILPFVLAQRLAGPSSGAVAGSLGSTCLYIIMVAVLSDTPFWLLFSFGVGSVLVGLSFSLWQPVILYPFTMVWNSLLYSIDKQHTSTGPHLLRWHSGFWNEKQKLPLYGLDNHLVWVATQNPAEGQAAIRYLATGHQRWAAQAAQIELEAHRLEACASVTDIAQIHHESGDSGLSGPASTLLQTFRHFSQDVEAALNQTTGYHQRLTLREVVRRVNELLRELQRSDEIYTQRFYPIAAHWLQLVTEYAEKLTRIVELQQEIDNPYIFGVPLTRQQEIFVGRQDIGKRIELLILDRRRPPLFLYGQRRMGKTSLLHNLGRLLPNRIMPLYVDGQGLAGSQNYADLLHNLARQITKSAAEHRGLVLPPIELPMLLSSPFNQFNEWLMQVEALLHKLEKGVGLLILDEFEALDSILRQDHFDETRMSHMLRHLVQHHPTFKMLFASSHPLAEFHHWASYLINAQVVHISYLRESETFQLIERPVSDFALQYEPAASRFVHSLTRGHPHLIQLLCYEIVTLKNEHPIARRRLVRMIDVEDAIPKALHTGSFFFVDIEQNQINDHERALLHFLAHNGECGIPYEVLVDRFQPTLDGSLTQLLRRELIEQVDGYYRFQVDLIRRWFIT